MDDLRDILQRAHNQQLKAGGAVSSKLINELRRYRQRQLVVFVIVELIIICGVSFCAYYLTFHPNNSAQTKALAGLIGIGTGGGIELMRRIWREWSQTDLLLVLLPEASPAQVTETIDRLIKKL